MFRYTLRRLLFAGPVLIAVSMVNFGILCAAPSDPASKLPLWMGAEAREAYRNQLGLDQSCPVRYLFWARQFLVYEPAYQFSLMPVGTVGNGNS